MTSETGDLRALLLAFGTAALCAAATYAHPTLASLRPWLPGDPIPVVAALLPRGAPRVVEDGHGELVEAEPPPVEPPPAAPPRDDAPTPGGDRAAGVGLAARPPGVPTPLLDPEHRGMDAFYRALQRTRASGGLARAAHYGDSTIAADGITSTVRARLQRRFGDGGPGYLSAGMDPRWNIRADVRIGRHGTWDTLSLLLGGASGRYGFGGIVSTAAPDGYLSITGPRRDDGAVPLHHFELWYQAGPDGEGAARGDWWASVDGKGVGSGSARAGSTGDRFHVAEVPEGFTRAAFGATNGAVPFYGVVMETRGPGVVWDALGVVGIGTRSFDQYGARHLTGQVERRRPDLVVVMLGGNELGWPILAKGDGSSYVPYYQAALRRIRTGAPGSGCLVVTPLDQGTREGGAPGTKPTLARLVAGQKKAAEIEGCAFWNAFAAMGGEGAVVRWSKLRPPLAWTDLLHLSAAGQDIVGQLLADAIEGGYDTWVAEGRASRPAPPLPGPPP